MTEVLTWGVLGTATIARKCVIPAIQSSRTSTIRVLGSRDADSARNLARKHHIQKVVGGYDAVVNDPGVEAVYIPLPNHLHREWALKALDAGKHVLCEKPMALNARETGEMAAAAQDAGKILMEGLMYRFHPRSRRIFRLAADGRIGSLRLVRAAFCYRMDDGVLESGTNFRLKPEHGGGALMDVGCYGVSTARWFFGTEPVTVQAQAQHHTNGVDVHAVGTLKFEGGGLAVVEASFVSALQQTYTLVGNQAVIELPHDAYIPWDKDAVFSIRNVDQEAGETVTVRGADEYRLMVEHFTEAVRGRTRLEYSPEDSVRNMRVLDAMADAARSGKTIHLHNDV
ncbi:hypothetical protein D3OALGB2SA_4868 [Olavius algarvensis associated proteobacterium Delta 3]|nr:hypothetical protein D3OALGB2SA_4868 [Olavius algarvensis associated proteobacterium Delta 3]